MRIKKREREGIGITQSNQLLVRLGMKNKNVRQNAMKRGKRGKVKFYRKKIERGKSITLVPKEAKQKAIMGERKTEKEK